VERTVTLDERTAVFLGRREQNDSRTSTVLLGGSGKMDDGCAADE
jgi:hypothetical protein